MDLDYVSYAEFEKIRESLKKIGFLERQGHFQHPKCPFLIDFVTQPVAVGNELIKKFEEMTTQYGVFKLLTATDCVKDRLASFYYWGDRQTLDQAIKVCLDNKIDIKAIHKWSKNEGFENKFLLIKEKFKQGKKQNESKKLIR